jgi:PAS domain S-box-containing protein
MIVSWNPVVIIDIAGSIVTLILAVYCVILSWDWSRKKPDNIFRYYIWLLTLVIVLFAISRSFGHIVKQLLLLNGMEDIWKLISPFSGSINSVLFVVIFSFSLYFHRFQKMHVRIEEYKNNLEEMIAVRTEELQELNLTLENVLNSANPICITSVDGVILKANNAYWAIWPGVNEKEKQCCKSRPGAFCGTDRCPLQQIKDGKKDVLHEDNKNVDGTIRTFMVTARPFLDIHGELVGIVESFQDISSRKQTELALASEREQLAVTLRSIGDGVITTDLDANIVLINRITEQLTGWSQEEAVGKPVGELFQIVDEKTGKPCRNPVEAVLASCEFSRLTGNTVLVARDGAKYNIEESGAPIFNRESEIIGVVLVFRDVTEERKDKEELFKAQKLESVGVLAGGIAHDFNNILAAILGSIELAGMSVGSENAAYPLLEAAKQASLRAKHLTQQLLVFSKGGDPVKQITSIRNTITEATNFVLHGSALSCKFDIPDDLWLVDIDPGQIAQVVQNLVLNAKAAMPEGGNIRISGENVQEHSSDVPGWLADTGYIKIRVEDDGCGIAEEHLGKIFDPYFSTKQEGSGLGLAITHSIIQKHQGIIDVHSEVGVGTIFTIYLPVSEKQVLPVSVEEVSSPETNKAKIIVMDDEAPVREIAMLMLRNLGHEALAAKDGNEAIKLYNEQKKSGKAVDVIIMDLTIPGGMGGKEAVQELLKVSPDAKVVVASGYANDPAMVHYKQYGFKAAICKPFLLDELRNTIKNVL